MALTATIYNLSVELADIDRGVYEKLDVCIARQPSETIEYMFMRVIAYCLEYGDGIVLTQGVAAGNEPAVLIRDLTGRVTAWIEVGMPDPERLHRGFKLAGRAAVYTHRDVQKVLAQLSAAKIDRLPVAISEPGRPPASTRSTMCFAPSRSVMKAPCWLTLMRR